MKQSNQQPNRKHQMGGLNPDSQSIPSGFQKARGGFREIGGQVAGFYRYLPGNRAEIMVHFQHREQIAKLCQRLQLRLEAEFDLAALKNNERRKRARRIGAESTTAPVGPGDANQLDLLDSTNVAFSGAPENSTAAPATARIESTPAADSTAPVDPRTKDPIKASKSKTSTASPDQQTRPTQSKPATQPDAPLTLEESLSGIRALGPASVQTRENQKRKSHRSDASA